MARPPKGKPLTLRPIRLDDDVWAECQRLGKEHGTINEGLAVAQAALRIREDHERTLAATGDLWHKDGDRLNRQQQEVRRQVRRGPRLKGDKQR